jgi:hypothetical protein
VPSLCSASETSLVIRASPEEVAKIAAYLSIRHYSIPTVKTAAGDDIPWDERIGLNRDARMCRKSLPPGPGPAHASPSPSPSNGTVVAPPPVRAWQA